MAASSTTILAYLRPRPASGSSRLQQSMLPPPARSSRCCCSDLLLVTGCRISRNCRQDCSRNLNVGANHAHANPSAAPRAVRSMPSVVLPIWRPQTATLKRRASAIIVCCARCSAGRLSECELVGRSDEPQRLRCCGDAHELICENTVGNGELVGFLGSAVLLVTEHLGLSDQRTQRGAEVGHDQLGVGLVSFLRCKWLQPCNPT